MIPYKNPLKAIHQEGYIFIIIFALVTILLNMVHHIFFSIGLVATVWCAYFFRNPTRVTPTKESLVVSAADGMIQNIIETIPPAELNMGTEKMIRVSVFLNVFDVHINRAPAEGEIKLLHYHPGKFFNASLDKASIHNERQSVVMEMKHKKEKIAFVQIAGLIARRILCNLEDNQQVKTGEEYGLIRFGSRVDLYLPLYAPIMVSIGQRAIGGETIIADFSKNKSQELDFEIR